MKNDASGLGLGSESKSVKKQPFIGSNIKRIKTEANQFASLQGRYADANQSPQM